VEILEHSGLTEQEARKRFAEFGPNELEKKSKATVLSLLLGQFDNFIIILLLAAAGVSFFVGDALDAGAILVAVFLSVSLGAIQEYQGERAMESLIKMTALKARVIRDGKEQTIDTRDLVPGDIIVVCEGDKMPADAQVLHSTGLFVDESMLTGESTTIEKGSGLPGEGRLLYMGTVVARGKGTCAVKATGMKTEMGRIVKTIQVKEDKTPLQKKLDWLGKRIGLFGIAACIIVFFTGMLLYPKPWEEMFLIAVTLAVASVPEGLATTVTITLAIGMKKMASKNAIVRKLLAVESLGSVTVICSDKTGTITQNKMTVKKIFANNTGIEVTGDGYDGPGRLVVSSEPISTPKGALKMLIDCASLCNSSAITRINGKADAVGDPTEVALLVLGEKAGIDYAALRKECPGESDPLFDSKRKMMVSVNAYEKTRVVFAKGAFESLIERSDMLLTDKGETALKEADRKRLTAENEALAGKGMRVLAFAYKKVGKRGLAGESDSGFVFLGLAGMIDPPREEVFDAIKQCEGAGIRVVMITGDNPLTAKSIARQVGIFREGSRVVTGVELEKMNDRELRAIVGTISVYARVMPEQKLRIVDALKANGQVVAMTGDGVNDVPGLKKADVGIAMGSGTDVAKESSDIVLADDNFATIVRAVKYGRNIYDNIRNFVRFQFSTNVAAVATMFIVPFTGLPLPFTPLELLWINIIMDGPPALALGVEPPRGDVMKKKPRDPNENILSGVLSGIFLTGVVMCFGTIVLLYLSVKRDAAETTTLAFTGFVVFQLLNALNCRSNRESFLSNFWKNKYLLLALLISAVLQLLIIYNPFLQGVFKTTALELEDWAIILGMASTVLAAEELRKYFLRRREHAKHV
jgi:P-type Ca2+ transporter type 2C